MLWLDCDREGEAIGFEVRGFCSCQGMQKHLGCPGAQCFEFLTLLIISLFCPSGSRSIDQLPGAPAGSPGTAQGTLLFGFMCGMQDVPASLCASTCCHAGHGGVPGKKAQPGSEARAVQRPHPPGACRSSGKFR